MTSPPDPSPGVALRGDYSRADELCQVDQDWGSYTPGEHELWRRLHQRQSRLVPGAACRDFLAAVAALDCAGAIPRFDAVNKSLGRATGWQLVAVPGLVPDAVFFAHLAARRFPVTRWLRTPAEFDYIVEPDVFHDFFGHVPLLFDPRYADYLQAYGAGGLKAQGLGALESLARLYWYTVEFGLVHEDGGLRIYGAGILSSAGEVAHSLRSPGAHRLRFDLERILRTGYHIDRFQDCYFVIDSFEQLVAATAADFTPVYARLRDAALIEPGALQPGERPLPAPAAPN